MGIRANVRPLAVALHGRRAALSFAMLIGMAGLLVLAPGGSAANAMQAQARYGGVRSAPLANPIRARRSTAVNARALARTEVAGPGGAGTFTNYTNAGGYLGPRIAPYQAVQVTCALTGFRVADGNPWWYQIASSPWADAYYASADNFYNNGATSGSLIGTPYVDPAVPLCGNVGGGSTGGGETGGGSTGTGSSPTAQWQVSGPAIGGSLELGSAYVLRFSVKNVGSAAGNFTMSASGDPTCTTSQGASNLAPGVTAQLRFVCFHKWQWLEPYNTGYSQELNAVLGRGTQMWQSLQSKLDLYRKITNALGVLRIPSSLASSISTFNDAVELANLLNDDYNTLRPLGLLLQNKIWAKSYTTNFSYSAAASSAPTSFTTTLYVPSYKWAAYGDFTWTASSAVAFAISGQLAAIVYPKISWFSWLKPLMLAAKNGLPYLAQKALEASKVAYAAAYDPDPDYTSPPVVTYEPTTSLDSIPDGPIKDYFVALSQAMDVEAARSQAYIRYAGAMEAQDDGAAAMQMAAIQSLTAREQELLRTSPQGERQIISVLPATFTTSDQQSVLDAFASPDFANSEVGQAMVAAGASTDDVTTLAQAVSESLVAGDDFDLASAVDGIVVGGGMLLGAGVEDANQRLASTQVGAGKPSARITLDKSLNADGSFDAPVTATISADPNGASSSGLEYGLDGSAFVPYTAPVVISDPGRHTLTARAVAGDGTAQDPPIERSVWIAPQHTPPIAAVVDPYRVVRAQLGLPVRIIFDGSPSRDVNGDALTYSWAFDDGTTTAGDGATVTLTVPSYGVHTGRLTVNNGFYSATAEVAVNVVDVMPPTVEAPADISVIDGPDAGRKIAAWLTAIRASDDDPAGSVATSNDYAGNVRVGSPVVVTWTAVDSAGNAARASALLTLIDGTPPKITPQISGAPGKGGWYTSDVQLHWEIVDSESAVRSESGCADTTIAADTDASGQVVTCTASSEGGSASETISVKRDATPPTIIASRAPLPNARGWNNVTVTAMFACSDGASGVASCPGPIALGDGSGQSASATAVDAAGNTATTSVVGINVDTKPPALIGTPVGQPNPAGWYRDDVAVRWSCTDVGSGIEGSCPTDGTIAGEGSRLSLSATVSDLAGNLTAAASDPVNIDRTPPRTAITAPTTWVKEDVVLALRATDNLSGVATTFYSLDGGRPQAGLGATITSEGRHTLEYWSVDNAGNLEQSNVATILIDKTPPSIDHALSAPPNSLGWNTTDVLVTFTCTDSLSGIGACSVAQLLAVEGRAIPVTGIAMDIAGNTSLVTVLVSIDKTPPTINIAPDRMANANGWYNADVAIEFRCADALSGVVSCPRGTILGEGAGQSASGMATDEAGNSETASLAGINVDKTPPKVAYSGNEGLYTVDQTVAISCAAFDALSGVATTTCSGINGPAWSFGLGTTTRSASATDRAGNSSNATTSFTVSVSCTSLKALVSRFSSDASVTSGLNAKLDAVCSAPNASARAGKLGAFDNQLSAQTGKALTAVQADVLRRLAESL